MSEDGGSQAVESIRGRLLDRIAALERVGHGSALGGWVGDAARARMVSDDFKSGRTFWDSAHRQASQGLKELATGNANRALALLLAADDCMLAALTLRLRPDDLHQLAKPARQRGRRKIALG